MNIAEKADCAPVAVHVIGNIIAALLLPDDCRQWDILLVGEDPVYLLLELLPVIIKGIFPEKSVDALDPAELSSRTVTSSLSPR